MTMENALDAAVKATSRYQRSRIEERHRLGIIWTGVVLCLAAGATGVGIGRANLLAENAHLERQLETAKLGHCSHKLPAEIARRNLTGRFTAEAAYKKPDEAFFPITCTIDQEIGSRGSGQYAPINNPNYTVNGPAIVLEASK